MARLARSSRWTTAIRGSSHAVPSRPFHCVSALDSSLWVVRTYVYIQVDYYHANTLLVLSDEEIAAKAKRDLDTMLGSACAQATVVDAAVVKLPNAVNWYYPGSYDSMPDLASSSIPNAYFVGDLVRARTSHGGPPHAFPTCNRAHSPL